MSYSQDCSGVAVGDEVFATDVHAVGIVVKIASPCDNKFVLFCHFCVEVSLGCIVCKILRFYSTQPCKGKWTKKLFEFLDGNVQIFGVSKHGNSARGEYFIYAGKFVIESDKGSIGMLQRKFKIGFNRAARIMDQLCEAGVVGEEEGTKPRKVLMSMEEFEQYIDEYV